MVKHFESPLLHYHSRKILNCKFFFLRVYKSINLFIRLFGSVTDYQFRFKLGKVSAEIEDKATIAVHKFLSLLPKDKQTAAIKLEVSTCFIRALGFVLNQKVPLKNINWDHPDFVKCLVVVGQRLPWQQFIIYAKLPTFQYPYVIIELQIRGIFKHMSHEAAVRISEAKLIAQSKFTQARERVIEQLVSLNNNLNTILDIFDDEELPLMQRQANRDESVLNDENLEHLAQLEMQRFQNKKNVAWALKKCLEENVVNDLQLALCNPVVIIANEYRKRINPKDVGKDVYNALHIQVTAAKLGIPFSVLEANPSFFVFATKNAIHRYLMVYNHELRFNTDTNQIFIMYKGEFVEWSIANTLIQRTENDPLILKGQYSRTGIIDLGLHNWKKLEPFIRLPPVGAVVDPNNTNCGKPPSMRHDWGDRYILEFCSWILDKPRLGGDHAWIRLKSPSGDVYSVGQYRPRKFGFHEQFIFPMKIKMSEFSSPDICEFWSGPYVTLAFEITEEQFLAMKEQIEKDQNAKEHIYQLFHGNCVNYAMSIAYLADIKFPTQIPIVELLVDEKLRTIGRFALNSRISPPFMHNFFNWLWAVNFNWFSLLLGSGMVSNEVKLDPKYSWVEPYIRDLKDLTDTEKVIAHHPYMIGEYVRKEVEAWRADKLSGMKMELETLERQLSATKSEASAASIIYGIDKINTVNQTPQ